MKTNKGVGNSDIIFVAIIFNHQINNRLQVWYDNWVNNSGVLEETELIRILIKNNYVKELYKNGN